MKSATLPSHVLFDRRGNNPYCHHRALKPAEKGTPERFYLDRPSAGIPLEEFLTPH